MVHRLDVVRHRFGVAALVVPGLHEPHGIGMDLLAGEDARGGGDEEGRVEPAAREHPQGHVGHQLALHGAGQRRPERVGRRQSRWTPGRGGGAPVGTHLHALLVGHEQVPGWELVNSFEHRVGRGDVAEGAIQRQGRPIHAARLVGEREQRLDLGREADLAVHARPEERFLARSIARQEEAPAAVVPDREPEHAVEPVDHAVAVALVEWDDVLDVAAGSERVAPSCGLAPQVGRVVNLAVAHHPDRPVRALEGLLARGEIHDGETPRADPRTLVAHDPLAVGAAMPERLGHAGEALRVVEGAAGEGYGAEDATHGSGSCREAGAVRGILEREEDALPAGVAPKLGHLALDPKRR